MQQSTLLGGAGLGVDFGGAFADDANTLSLSLSWDRDKSPVSKGDREFLIEIGRYCSLG